MSASPQTGIVYEIRANLSKLAGDLKKQEQMALDSARKVRAEAEEVMARAIQAEIKFKANLDDVERERFKATGEGLGGEGEGGGMMGVVESMSGVHSALREVGHAAMAIGVAVEAVNVGLSATKLLTANITGDYESQVEAAKAMKESIGGIPVIGKEILKVGEAINGITIEQFTHEQQYVAEMKKATEEQEKQIKADAKRIEQRIKFTEAFGKFAGGLSDKAESESGTEEERALREVARKKKELEDYLANPQTKDKNGNLTQTAQAFKQQAEAAIDELDKIAWEKQQRANTRAYNELRALRAENAGDKDLAEDIRFAQQRADAEIAAEKRSFYEWQKEKELTRELDTKRHIEREKKAAEEIAANTKRANEEAEKKKKEADREAAETAKSDLAEIEKRFDAVYENANQRARETIAGDKEADRIAAEAARQKFKEEHQQAGEMSGSAAMVHNFGGTNGLLSEQKQTNSHLARIERHLSRRPVAVAG